PADVGCGRHLAVRTVAVATGPFDEEALRAAGADVVLPDFVDTGRALAGLLG
ncbi:MAG TPA: hydrolase, partial [Chloroflexi bacterium]|nr:hydrolase [Chloroflexota bacterium]